MWSRSHAGIMMTGVSFPRLRKIRSAAAAFMRGILQLSKTRSKRSFSIRSRASIPLFARVTELQPAC
ncbi:MAG: hypothetical protein ABL908_19720 [Hyphomicrobium sp.]